jgi:hypothetical protein
MRRRILHKFKLTEISVVDRPAQAHAKAVIMKRQDDDDDDLDLPAIAKALVEEGVNHGATKEDFESAIRKNAQTKFPSLSSAQQFTKYATTDETGKLLFKAALKAQCVEQAAQDYVPRQKAFGPAGEEVNALIEAMMRRGLGMAESFSRVTSDPRHEQLMRRYREEARKATEAVAQTRSPIRNAERLYSRDFRLT